MSTQAIPEQLHRAFKPGNDARTRVRKTQKIAPKFAFIGFVVTILVPALIWGVIPRAKEAAAEARQEQQAEVAATVAPPKSPVSAQNDLGKEYMLVVTDVWTDEINLPNNRCFRSWGVDASGGKDPDHKDVRTEVRGGNKDTWYSWEEFLRLRAEKKAPFTYPSWVRFSTKEDIPTAIVYYTFYDLKSSRCSI